MSVALTNDHARRLFPSLDIRLRGRLVRILTTLRFGLSFGDVLRFCQNLHVRTELLRQKQDQTA